MIRETQMSNVDHSTVRSQLGHRPISAKLIPTTPPNEVRYKSLGRLLFMTIILALTPLIFGYCLSQISTIPLNDLPHLFGFPASQLPTIDGILVGSVPIGGMIGGPIYHFFLQCFSRKQSHYVLAVINIIGVVFCQIALLPTLIIGRVLLGFCCGIYTAISPIYIRQISPKQITGVLLSFFSFFKILGVVFCYGLGLGLRSTGWPQYWRIVFAMPGIIAVIQSAILFLVIPDSPVELLEREKIQQCKIQLRAIYKQNCIESAYNDLVLQIQQDHARIKTIENLGNNAGDHDYSSNKTRALIFCIYIAVLRQFVGGTTIISYSGDIIGQFNAQLGNYGSLIVNGVQLLATVLHVTLIAPYLTRRQLFHFGVMICCVAMLGAAITAQYNVPIAILVFMMMFALFNGLFASPVFWYYTAEIVPPSSEPLVIFCSWTAIAIVSILPPIITGHMPGHNAYPLFYFFFGCGFVGFFINWFYLVQTRCRSYEEIVADF